MKGPARAAAEVTPEQQEANLAMVLSGFFDPVWYISRYPDVRDARIDPLLHFIRFGAAEMRDPNRFFDSAWYLEHYPDVQASGLHPLLHYLQAGASELRNPHPRFDAVYYADRHPDSAVNPLMYHIRVGARLGNLTEKPLYIKDYLASGLPPLTPPDGVVVDVVIPVYRGLDETRLCLESVLAAPSPLLGDVIVVDDRSPDADLVAYLDRLAASGAIRLVRNRRNLGFVRSVNAGMTEAGDHDVILLNSDTEVPARWLDRLAAQAYAQPRIATVSPLSNNATICGYPADSGGPIAHGRSLGEIDSACATANAGRFVPAPTTVGFCMFIRRAAIDETGLFDAVKFGMGYGEENDFCMRAAALGWRHHIACDTFVYHKGSVSFGEKARTLSRRATALLLERYPNYTRDIAWHVKLDDIGPFRFALTAALLRRSGLPVVLMVSHGLGGGVRRNIEDMVTRLNGRGQVLVLESSTRGASLSVPDMDGHPVLTLPSERLDDLAKVLRECGVQRVHVHHLLGMDLDVRALIHRLGVPFDLSVHDYHAICPQVNLLPAPSRLYCNEPGPAACNACIANRASHGARDILSWRAERAWQFKEADRVFCPSNDVLERMQRYGLANRAILAPLEPVEAGPWPLDAAAPGDEKLRIVVLGVLAEHKGSHTVAAVAEAADPASVEIHLIGYTEDNFPAPALKRMKITGRYDDTDLPGLIAAIRPHVIWFPAAWPETFSYTLSVAIASGFPIAATRIGAFTERLAGRPFTWMMDHRTSPDGWLDLFAEIRTALPADRVTATPVMRAPVADFFAGEYLRPAATGTVVYPVRIPGSRPVIAVIPERYDTGQPTPCAYIRLLQPLDHPDIGGDFEVLLADGKSILDIAADIIVTQRYALPDTDAVDALAAHARETGAILLYDLDDDLLNIPRNHPEAASLRPKAKTVRRLLAAADAVWVSTEALAETVRPLARDVTVVANGLDERIWVSGPPNRPPASGPARLFCMGTTTHDRDFAMILPALIRLKQDFATDIEIDVLGMTALAELPAGINRMGVPHHATQSYPGFVNWLTSVHPGWHIGLSPVLETPFNRCKSAIKAMDYAALGLAVLASDGPVYRGSVADGAAGQLVGNDPRSWYAAISWLIRDRDYCQSIAARSRDAFLRHASLAVQAPSRRAVWDALLGRALR